MFCNAVRSDVLLINRISSYDEKTIRRMVFLYYKNNYFNGLQGLQAVLEYATIIDNEAE